MTKGKLKGVGSLVPADGFHEKEAGEDGFALVVHKERDTVLLEYVGPVQHGYGSDKDAETERLWLTLVLSEKDLLSAAYRVRDEAVES